jgi:hypothetical protein
MPVERQLRPYQAAYSLSDWAFAPAFYMAYPPRLGKTFAEITAMQRRTDVTRTLIVGPKNALALTWADELEKAWIRQVPLVSGTIRERAERLTQLLADNISHPVAVTINYDILDAWIEPIMHLGAGWNFRGTIYPTKHEAEVARALAKSPRIIDLLMRWNPQALICDEAHYLSSAGSHRSQALRKLARGVKYRRLRPQARSEFLQSIRDPRPNNFRDE